MEWDSLKRDGTVWKVLVYIGIIIGIYLGMKYLLPLVLPFLIAFIMVKSVYPFLHKVHEKTHINESILIGSVILMVVLFAIGILLLIGNLLLPWAAEMIRSMGCIQSRICQSVHSCCEDLEDGLGIQADMMEKYVLDQIYSCSQAMRQEMTPLVMGSSIRYMGCAASVLAAIAITVISILLLMKDYENIITVIKNSIFWNSIYEILEKVMQLIYIFLRAQLLIMSVIACICFGGFYVLGMKHPVFPAILTSFLDMLPFIGTGIVMVPMALWSILQQQYIQGIGYLVLYGICALTRECLEPKLMGRKLGIYPIGILFAIYVGVKLYGIGGILLGPVMLLLVKEIFQLLNRM